MTPNLPQVGSYFSEDAYGKKIDKCISDTILKLGGGLVIGGVFSLLFFRRRAWPIIIGSGFGTGVAFTNCSRELNAK